MACLRICSGLSEGIMHNLFYKTEINQKKFAKNLGLLTFEAAIVCQVISHIIFRLTSTHRQKSIIKKITYTINYYEGDSKLLYQSTNKLIKISRFFFQQKTIECYE